MNVYETQKECRKWHNGKCDKIQEVTMPVSRIPSESQHHKHPHLPRSVCIDAVYKAVHDVTTCMYTGWGAQHSPGLKAHWSSITRAGLCGRQTRVMDDWHSGVVTLTLSPPWFPLQAVWWICVTISSEEMEVHSQGQGCSNLHLQSVMDTVTQKEKYSATELDSFICVGVGTEISLSHKTWKLCSTQSVRVAFLFFKWCAVYCYWI